MSLTSAENKNNQKYIFVVSWRINEFCEIEKDVNAFIDFTTNEENIVFC